MFERTLAEGESVAIRPSGILYREPTVTAQLTRRASRKGHSRGSSLYLAAMTGPGRVGIQSMASPPASPGQRQDGWQV